VCIAKAEEEQQTVDRRGRTGVPWENKRLGFIVIKYCKDHYYSKLNGNDPPVSYCDS
jgi:hypothetical protein